MKFLTPNIIAEVTGGKFVGKPEELDIKVQGAERDNRDITAENLFICIEGEKVDGHDFANAAFDAGAACALAEKEIPNAKGPYVLVESTLLSLRKLAEYYRGLFDIPFIGLTGSVGKTTCKELVAAVLREKLNIIYTAGNLNNEIGVPLTLLSLNETHQAAVIEMGIGDFGDMSILAQMVRPTIFIMTKIGYAHLDKLGDLNGVLKGKTEAFAYMKPDSLAIMNGDDDLLRTFDTKRRTITFGLNDDNDFRSINIIAGSTEAVEFDIAGDLEPFHVRIPSYGSHLAGLAPAACAVGRELGLSNDEIAKGLSHYEPVGGRANAGVTGKITLINDCYNANPNSVKAALASLASLKGRRVAILGDMVNLGPDADKLHYEVGVFCAEQGIDLLICNGREIIDLYKGYNSVGVGESLYFPSKVEMIKALPGLIKENDNVLVKASNAMKFWELLPTLEEL